MPVQFKQVISSFLTQSAYKKLAVSAAWHILPGFEVLMLNGTDMEKRTDFMFVQDGALFSKNVQTGSGAHPAPWFLIRS
jgi:hypothetical protein